MSDTIKSVDVPSVHGMVVLNPDGSAVGAPVGGATADNQTNGSQKTQIVDAGGEAVTVTGGKLDVNATASLAGQSIPATGATEAVTVQIVDGSGNQITTFGGGTQYTEGDTDASITGTAALVEGAANSLAVLTQPLTDTQLRATAVPISASSLPLPTGAATEATQLLIQGDIEAQGGDINNVSNEITSLNAKVPALGQALEAASVPVVLPATQITALSTTQYTEGDTDASITGTAALVEGAGNALAVLTQPLTDTQLRATAVPVSATSLPLPTGASSSANQTTIIGHLDGVEGLLTTIDADTGNVATSTASLDTKLPAQGQALMAASTPVVIASNQSAVPVSGTFYQATQPVSVASVPSHDVTNAGTFAVQVTSAPSTTVTATNLDIRDLTSVSDSVEVKQATGTNLHVVVDTAPTTAVTGTFWQATQPVSGTVTANLSATDNAVLDNIDTSTASHYITGVGHGVKTVTTAGTDVVLAASTACKRVDIQAQTDNTGLIAVGGSGVDATVATGTGVLLSPGDIYSLEIDNLTDIYIDSTVSGDGVRYSYFT